MKYYKCTLIILILFFSFSFLDLYPQQIQDSSFVFWIYQTAYKTGKGPVILIDEAHNNFHTLDGGFYALGKLLKQDGYRVKKLSSPIDSIELLKDCKILVIANSLNKVNVHNWVLPTPSAFTDLEIYNIKKWVENGNSLLLIADHMPFAGAAQKLGEEFGFEYLNGFAFTRKNVWPPSVFSLKNKTLAASPLVKGIKEYENIDSVITFTGSAFEAPDSSIHILTFTRDNYSQQPDTAWRFTNNTPKQNLEGFDQGAVLKFGKGKVAVFGEAAMFTAQIINGDVKVGFNSDTAPQNAQFILNLIHWLDGVKEYKGIIHKK